MLQGLIAKKTIDIILKQVMKKREINKLRKYVEEDNELDIQMKQLQKTVAKQGKYIEELEKEVAILKKESHPPIFSVSDYKDVLKRLERLENAK
tara:strand:+ start:334 stop:615 length:282 start_codon:yes stop_codon:yes gene_type:complete